MTSSRLTDKVLTLALIGIFVLVGVVGFVWLSRPSRRLELAPDLESFRLNEDGSASVLVYRAVTEVGRRVGKKGLEHFEAFSGRQVLLQTWPSDSTLPVSTDVVGDLLPIEPHKCQLKGWSTKPADGPSILVWQGDFKLGRCRISSWQRSRAEFHPCDYEPNPWDYVRSYNGQFVLSGRSGRYVLLSMPGFSVVRSMNMNSEVGYYFGKSDGSRYLSNDGCFAARVTWEGGGYLHFWVVDLANGGCSQGVFGGKKWYENYVIGFDHVDGKRVFALASHDPDRPDLPNPAVFLLVEESGPVLTRVPAPPELNLGIAKAFSWNASGRRFERVEEKGDGFAATVLKYDGLVSHRNYSLALTR
jgi:hypothetical protein